MKLEMILKIEEDNFYYHSYFSISDELLAAAHDGDAEAQNDLGVCYYTGKGSKLDEEEDRRIWKKAEAVRLWEQAAEHGSDCALFNLGLHYYRGEDDECKKKAVMYWKKVMEQVDNLCRNICENSAAYNLGVCYYTGEGVEQNKRIAVSLWDKISGLYSGIDIQKGCYNIGVCYFNGEVKMRDAHEAYGIWSCYKYTSVLAEIDVAQAICLYYGDGVSQDIKASKEFWLKAAGKGSADAQYEVGTWYLEGSDTFDVKKDSKIAKYWLEKAAAQGHEGAKKKRGLN